MSLLKIAYRKNRIAVAALAATMLLSACAGTYESYMQEGKRLREKHDNAKARESFHNAVMIAQKTPKLRDRLIKALMAEKDVAVDMQDKDGAIKLLSEAADLQEKAEGYREAALCQKEMGDLNANDNPSTALNYYKAASADLNKAGLDISPEHADVLAAIGDLSTKKNDWKGGLKYMERSCAILDKIKYDSNGHNHAVYLHKLAFIYNNLGRETEAIEADEKAKTFEMDGIKDRIHDLSKYDMVR
jgi:tetratricopeptide (TPR) repeat protein